MEEKWFYYFRCLAFCMIMALFFFLNEVSAEEISTLWPLPSASGHLVEVQWDPLRQTMPVHELLSFLQSQPSFSVSSFKIHYGNFLAWILGAQNKDEMQRLIAEFLGERGHVQIQEQK